MDFDRDEFVRKHGTNHKTTITIKGYGAITVNGYVEDLTDASVAALLAAHKPTHKVLGALAAVVAGQAPTGSLLANLSQVLA